MEFEVLKKASAGDAAATQSLLPNPYIADIPSDGSVLRREWRCPVLDPIKGS